MLTLRGKLYAESPIYRGNARKTLFTRDGDGTQRLVSLAGEIQGTAQALMDAFIGQSRDGRNTGLLHQLWLRLYGAPLPAGLITAVDCKLQKESYPPDNFFDLRMGIRLNEDRWAVEANANYKYETLFRHSVFDFSLTVNENLLRQGDNQARLYFLLQELREGRFWFGAGKSKGLGRCRLDLSLPFPAPAAPPRLNPAANHLRWTLTFNAANPVLVGWNWGKVDPETPAFAAVEGRTLIQALRSLPEPIQKRLEMGLGGPILSPEDWKGKFDGLLPRVIAIWLQEQSRGEVETWVIPAKAFHKLATGKNPLGKKVIEAATPFLDQPFPSEAAVATALMTALGEKANMAPRILKLLERRAQPSQSLNLAAWQSVAASLGLDPAAGTPSLTAHLSSEAALTQAVAQLCAPILPQLHEQIDQQIKLLQSDPWVDRELAQREEHLRIKTLLLQGKITPAQWEDRARPPDGVSLAGWQEFLDSHRKVSFQHMLSGPNLRKSITNDQNFIAFLKSYRELTRQELGQPHHIDFRSGGRDRREISRQYGKPYDTVFMRMLAWSPSTQGRGLWEVYIPGSTLKGAFRKRASQVLKTLWGESARTQQVLDRLFGVQGNRGLVLFSDAYLTDPLDPNRAWCSMDGVKMDPRTGQPFETAKADYLFAYGTHLTFQAHLDLQDVGERDLEALSVLLHLLRDFQNGDVPLGGEKTSGFGWVKSSFTGLTWLTGARGAVDEKLFPGQTPTPDGLWQKVELDGPAAAALLQSAAPLPATQQVAPQPPKAAEGFVSHRAFGGYSGLLSVEAEVLTSVHISESGEPSFKAALSDGVVYGSDFFSMSPPEATQRTAQRVYALPSKSLRGLLRHIYSIASDSAVASPDLAHLNPVDSLFGWVGKGPNQSLMGRVAVSFGLFTVAEPDRAWFKVPYPYGHWQFVNGQWTETHGAAARKVTIDKNWRLFPHTPLAPCVTRLADFQPDTAQASYLRAILPGARARFTVRFWNLTESELQRLTWCVVLEDGLAHKLGNHRYLGFGSVRLHILPDSFLTDWAGRYGNKPAAQWQAPFQTDRWLNPKVVLHYGALRQLLDAKSL